MIGWKFAELVNFAMQDFGADVSSEVMEMDELNRHDCMVPLIGLIKHLVDSKISAQPKQVSLRLKTWECRFESKLYKLVILAATYLSQNLDLFLQSLETKLTSG